METNVAITAARFVNFRKHKKLLLISFEKVPSHTILGFVWIERGLSSMGSIRIFEDYSHWDAVLELLLKITGTSSRGLSVRTNRMYASLVSQAVDLVAHSIRPKR
jgi:hypothetical protein